MASGTPPISFPNLATLRTKEEEIVLRQLFEHLRVNNLEIVFQSVYKVYYCTKAILVKVKSNILDYLDENKARILSSLDLSAAFDMTNHEILV